MLHYRNEGERIESRQSSRENETEKLPAMTTWDQSRENVNSPNIAFQTDPSAKKVLFLRGRDNNDEGLALSRTSLLHLQRTRGNKYVNRMLQATELQGGDASVAQDVAHKIKRSSERRQPQDGDIKNTLLKAMNANFSGVQSKNEEGNTETTCRGCVTNSGIETQQTKLTHGATNDVYKKETADKARYIVTNEHKSGLPQIEQQVNSDKDNEELVQTAPYGMHIQRENGDAESSPDEIADDFDSAAYSYFDRNMSMELRNAAATEGAAIGRRASTHMADRVRETCEPYERDQELDTNIMNTVFAAAGGAANVTRNVAGGSKPGNVGGINLASRFVNIGLNLAQVWMPTLAGYRTVGELKDAATREMAGDAAQSGETTSSIYGDYETGVMDQLNEDFEHEVTASSSRIRGAEDSQHAQNLSTLGQALFGTWRTVFLNKLRQDYGSRSSHAETMISSVEGVLNPKLTTLGSHLEEAKISRQRWQAAGAFGGGIAGGAALGAGIGAFAGGVGAVPGAIIGGIVGGIVGGVGAISILWD